MPRRLRVRSTTSTSFFLPSLDRCDRPTAASFRTSGVQPGRLAQGPDEKSGRAGRRFGFIALSLAEELRSGGGAWPAAPISGAITAVNVQLSATNEAVAAISSRHEGLAMVNGQTDGSRRLNIGCGLTPTPDWRDYDNSPIVWRARLPLPASVLSALGLLSTHNRPFFEASRRLDIRYADATAIPERDGSVDAVYSCHMLEHLDQATA